MLYCYYNKGDCIKAVRIEYIFEGENCLSGLVMKTQAEKQLKIYKDAYGDECKIVDFDEDL